MTTRSTENKIKFKFWPSFHLLNIMGTLNLIKLNRKNSLMFKAIHSTINVQFQQTYIYDKETYIFLLKIKKITSLVIMKHNVSIWKNKSFKYCQGNCFPIFWLLLIKRMNRMVLFTSLWNATLWVSGKIKIDKIKQR